MYRKLNRTETELDSLCATLTNTNFLLPHSKARRDLDELVEACNLQRPIGIVLSDELSKRHWTVTKLLAKADIPSSTYYSKYSTRLDFKDERYFKQLQSENSLYYLIRALGLYGKDKDILLDAYDPRRLVDAFADKYHLSNDDVLHILTYLGWK